MNEEGGPTEPDEERQRLHFIRLATLCCGAMAVGLGVVVLPLAISPSAPHRTAVFTAGVIAAALCAAGYFATLRGRVVLPVWALLTASTLGPVMGSPSNPILLACLPVGVGVACLLLSARATALVTVIATGMPFAMRLYLPDLDEQDVWALSVANLATSTVMLVTRQYNRRVRASATRRRRRYERMLESLPDGVLALDAQYRIVGCNRALLELCQWQRGDLLGEAVGVLGIEGSDLTRAAESEQLVEAALRRADGSKTPVESRPRREANEATGQELVVVVRGVEERRRAERDAEALRSQLRESRRLESLGQLAGGVAHDLNNMLTVILGNCESSGLEPEPAELREIRAASERAARLVSELLTFARKQPRQPARLDLGELLENIQGLLHRLVREDIQLSVTAPPGTWVNVDRTQLEQVVVNLVANARDALPTGGRIAIEVSGARLAGHALVTPGDYVVLSVRDDGQGMDQQTRERVFEPFFTTKRDRGTGLGLATAHAVVEQSGGFIDVQSIRGKGTTFRVHLPRSEPAEPTEPTSRPAASRASPSPTRARRVMVVDDERAIVTIVERHLKRAGYEVLSATSGNEALAIASEPHSLPDLLIADVVMPGMRGPELAKRLRERSPQLRVLFMSGYTAGEDVPAELLLAKPFDYATLERRVAEALSELSLDDADAAAGP